MRVERRGREDIYFTFAKRERKKRGEWVISHKTKISPEYSGLGGAAA